MPRKFVVIALVLPLLAIAIGIVRAELFLASGRPYTFQVEGFDPRDLLRGHYLQFRLRTEVTGEVEVCDASRERCCLCITEPPGARVTQVESLPCLSARSRCEAAIERRYLDEPLRYYVPEARARELEQRLFKAMDERNAEVTLVLDRDGHANVSVLRVNGEPIEQATPASR